MCRKRLAFGFVMLAALLTGLGLLHDWHDTSSHEAHASFNNVPPDRSSSKLPRAQPFLQKPEAAKIVREDVRDPDDRALSSVAQKTTTVIGQAGRVDQSESGSILSREKGTIVPVIVNVTLGIERGVDMASLMHQHLHLDPDSHAMSFTVVENSPAVLAGLVSTDLIVGVEGRPVSREESSVSLIENRQPGDILTFDILRRGRRQSIDVKLGARSDDPEAPFLGVQGYGYPGRLFLTILGQLGKKHGFAIGKVEQGSPADLAGIQPGDILLALDKQPVRTLLVNLSDYKPGDLCVATLLREGRRMDVAVTLAEAKEVYKGIVRLKGGAGGER